MGDRRGHAHDVNAATVVAAEQVAAASQERLHSLERELGVKQREVAAASRQVEQAEERKRQRAFSGSSATSAIDEALDKLRFEEAQVTEELEHSPHKQMLAAFVTRQRELEDEERALVETLHKHEDALAELRSRLSHPPPELLPRDEARAQLYVMWKRALAEKEELLRQARRRKHELMKDLKARHESQVVLLELERRAAVEALKETVRAEREREERHRVELAAVEESIKHSAQAMETFRKEFEQLRVAMLMDRMAKNVQVAGLLAKRQQLTSQAQAFQSTIEAAKLDAAESAKKEWESKLEAEHKAGEARLVAESQEISSKMARVRETLAERYESGFMPLLAEAEERHLQEVNRVTQLQRTLQEKEQELDAAHQRARELAVATAEGGGAGEEGAPVEDAATPAEVAEFERLRNSITTLWEQLDMPPEDIVSFLSECDMIAPFNRRVYNLYAEYHAQLALAGGSGSGVATSGGASPARNGSGARSGGLPRTHSSSSKRSTRSASHRSRR